MFPSPQFFTVEFSDHIRAKPIERRLKEDTRKMQKAWFYNKYGSIDVLQFGEFPVPKPGPGQILLKIRAAALNPVDFKKREGIFRSADSDFPVFHITMLFLFFRSFISFVVLGLPFPSLGLKIYFNLVL